MFLVRWVTKATDTHLEYVKFLVFTSERRLRERASMLRFTHIACLVLIYIFDVLCEVRTEILRSALTMGQISCKSKPTTKQIRTEHSPHNCFKFSTSLTDKDSASEKQVNPSAGDVKPWRGW